MSSDQFKTHYTSTISSASFVIAHENTEKQYIQSRPRHNSRQCSICDKQRIAAATEI